MSKISTKTASSTLRGACILTALSMIAPAAGIASENNKSAPPPKPAPAPAHPAAAPAAGRPGTGPTTGAAQPNNGRPATNSITTANHSAITTTNHAPVGPQGQPHGPITATNHGPITATNHGPITASTTHPPLPGTSRGTLPGHPPVQQGFHPTPGRAPGRVVDSRPYQFHGRPMMVDHRIGPNGRPMPVYYSRYTYHGVAMRYYRPDHYYSPAFYGWAGRRWAAPVHYGWGWRQDPWVAYYGPYFAPAPVYVAPTLWLADYVIAVNLEAAYQAQQAAAMQAAAGPPPAPLTPEVKQQIADEVQHQMQQEAAEANANAHGDVPNGPMGVEALFADNHPHVFVAGSDLSLTDMTSGRPCQITQGDVLQVSSLPAGNSTFATATVLSSKGGPDCGAAANVSVNVGDLQEMQNHMRETADEGFKELQAKQGQDGLPAAPADATTPPASGAFVDAAPPASDQQVADAGQGGAQPGMRQLTLTSATPAAPGTISAGQSIEAVVGNLGQPATILNFGVKQIYLYKNPGMKVTFINGKVAGIE